MRRVITLTIFVAAGAFAAPASARVVAVKRGSVTVRDFVKKKTVVVKAGKQYVAKRKR